MLERAARGAPTPASVLVTGETGTGKELLARHVHDASARTGAFVAVNCAALPKHLSSPSCSGTRRARSRARRPRGGAGRFEVADGGTLFLDEIGDISPRTQVGAAARAAGADLRARGRRHRASAPTCASSARRTATSAAWSPAGEFREDLYYRLAGYDLAIPPLRERGEDVVLLAAGDRRRIRDLPGVGRAELAEAGCAALRGHDWPGNIRELQGVLFRAAIDGDGKRITPRATSARRCRAKAGETKPLDGRVVRAGRRAPGSVSTGDLARVRRWTG